MEIWKNLGIEDLPGEIWKDIKNYEGLYKVSNLGRVKSLARKTKTRIIHEDKILKIKQSSEEGYLQAKLCKNSKIINPVVGRLVAEAFLEKPNYECIANHKNCIRYDNRVENLEWISQSQNIRYSYSLGRSNQKGSKNNASKITQEIANNIREFQKNNVHLSQSEIAKEFNLTRSLIKNVLNFKTWNY